MSRNSWSVVPWLLLSGWAVGSLGFGCASQASTAQALAIAGTAAVIVGASLAADNDCTEAAEGAGSPVVYCSPGLSKSTRKAGTAVAVAGAGVAAAGYALQPKGPDGLHRPAPAPRAPTQPYRLIRKAPPEPVSTEPVSPESVSPAEPAPGVLPETAPEPAPETRSEPAPASNAPAR
jgi:hypothetical protein